MFVGSPELTARTTHRRERREPQLITFRPAAAPRRRLLRATTALAAATVIGLALSACGGIDPTAETPDGGENALSVGIFVDNAFGDGDFFDQAAAAEDSLATELGATVETYEGQLQAQNFEPLLQDA